MEAVSSGVGALLHKSTIGYMSKKGSTTARFELARSKSNGLAIHRLNHSATLSCLAMNETQI